LIDSGGSRPQKRDQSAAKAPRLPKPRKNSKGDHGLVLTRSAFALPGRRWRSQRAQPKLIMAGWQAPESDLVPICYVDPIPINTAQPGLDTGRIIPEIDQGKLYSDIPNSSREPGRFC